MSKFKDYHFGFYCEGKSSPRTVVEMAELLRKAHAADPCVTRGFDLFASMYTFPSPFVEQVAETGKTAGYGGACHAEFLRIDIDHEDLEVALEQGVRLLEYIYQVSAGKLRPENILVAASGKKGLHVEISLKAFGSPGPSESFAAECKAVVGILARRADVTAIDLNVYDRVRLFRVMNSRHGETAAYKVPLFYSELTANDAIARIKELSKSPRKLIVLPESYDGEAVESEGDSVLLMPTQGTVPALEEIWREAAASVKNPGSGTSSGRYVASPYPYGSGKILKSTHDFVVNGPEEGNRAVGLFKASADLTRCGYSQETVHSTLAPVAAQSGLEPKEIDRQIESGVNIAARDGISPTSILPQDLAVSFVKQLPALTLVSYGGEWYQFRPGAGWVEANEYSVKGEIRRFLMACSRQPSNFRDRISVTGYLVNDVLGCVQALLSIADMPNEDDLDTSVFLRMDGEHILAEPAQGWIATRTHHIHVPTVAVALHREEPIPENAVRPADSSLFTQGVVPCEFNPGAVCPRWLQFVSEACSAPEMLWMLFGLSLSYDRQYNIFACLWGEGGTGKSTALNVLEKLNAGTHCGVPLTAFGEPFAPYPLTEHRVNIVQDMASVYEGAGSVAEREAMLKSCTAGEKKMVQKKYKDHRLRRLRALCCWGANAIPRFADSSKAISDRMRIIPFPTVFRNTPMHDDSLGEKLHSELPGILIWALRGYGALTCREGATFPETKESAEIKRDAIRATRPEEMFCDDELVVCPQNTVRSRHEPGREPVEETVYTETEEIYLGFKSYCANYGYKTPGMSRAIPNIVKYLEVEKTRISCRGTQRTVLKNVHFRGDSAKYSLCTIRASVPATPPEPSAADGEAPAAPAETPTDPVEPTADGV